MSRSLRLLSALPASALLLVGVLLLARCGEEPMLEPDAVPPASPVAESPSRLDRLRLQIRECLAAGGSEADEQVRALYWQILEQCDPDDLEARRVLGYTDFQAAVLGRILEPGEDPVPEAISNRKGYSFLDAVIELNRKRWLEEPEEIEAARTAVAAMHEHARKLVEDQVYRLGDGIRANIANDPLLGFYSYETAWAPPHLICYSAGERLTDFDLLKLPDRRQRNMLREEQRARRKQLVPAVAATARVFARLNTEFVRRFGEQLDLRPLDAPYGGRPDYRPGIRSYPDGVPLTVWVFASRDAYQEHHRRVLGDPTEGGSSHGYFLPSAGWIFTFDLPRSKGEREQQVRSLLRLGTHQLLHWYGRQRNQWGSSAVGQDFFGTGLAGDLSGVQVDENLELEFTGLNVDLLGAAQRFAAGRRDGGSPYPFFPVEGLVAITNYAEARRLSEKALKVTDEGALDLFFQQSWMFVRFLQEFEEGRYRQGFERYLAAYMSRETQFGRSEQVFRKSLDLDREDWARLDAEFRAFVTEDLLKRELP